MYYRYHIYTRENYPSAYKILKNCVKAYFEGKKELFEGLIQRACEKSGEQSDTFKLPH